MLRLLLLLPALLVVFISLGGIVESHFACSGSKPSPSPAPTTTVSPETVDLKARVPTASRDSCPIDPRICGLAEEVDKPLREFAANRIDGFTQWPADVRSIVSLLRPEAIPCKYGYGMVGDLCDGAPIDQTRLGIWFWNNSFGQQLRGVSMTELQQDFQFLTPRSTDLADDFGGPDLRLVAIGCPTTVADLKSCGDSFSLVFSSNATYPHDDRTRRYVRIVPIVWSQDGAPTARLVIPAAPIADNTLGSNAVLVTGGVVTGELAVYTSEPEWLSRQPAPAVGVFVPWRQEVVRND